MGYPHDILSSRAVIKHGNYAIVPPTGLVNNVVPGIENSIVSIVASPKMGASFAQYIVTVNPGGGAHTLFAKEDGIESFIYTIEGEGVVGIGSESHAMKEGGYAFSPAGTGMTFVNKSNAPWRVVLYKQRYIPLEGYAAKAYVSNVNDFDYRIYDNMENVLVKDLLPAGTDLAYDMNFHILSFKPGGCHPFIETHVQEHGAYILTGEGAYYIGEEWRMIKTGDFVWFGPYTTQGAYGVGRTDFTYVYSKDCNRDISL